MTNAQRFVNDHPEIFNRYNPFAMLTNKPVELPDHIQRVRCADAFLWNDDTDVIVDFYFEEGTINTRGKDEHLTRVAVHRVYLDGSWETIPLCKEECDVLARWIERNIFQWH